MEQKSLKSFKDLIVWQKAADLTVLIYRITDKFPRSEVYGITDQMKRAIISVSSNIAEGFKRVHKKEKIQFYNIAYGSISELESQIEISKRLGFLSEDDYQDLILLTIEVSKMINGLVKSLNTKFYILNSGGGFTVVELMVSMALFVVLAALAAGTFIQSLKTQRMITALSASNDNATQTIERLTREIRTGFFFSAPSEDVLKFVNYEGNSIAYKLVNGSVGRCVGDAECNEDKNYQLITPPEVKIKNLKFKLKGTIKDNLAPRVTILLDVSSLNNMKTNLQTTVSARTLISE